jgi:curved DNA binding protein
MEPEEADRPDETPHNPAVTNKYKTAADVINAALASLIPECTAGRPIIELCAMGDDLITQGLAGVYTSKKQKKIEKGIAFPTCISPNSICGHYSPIEGDSFIVGEGDVLKIEMGAHIDGYISTAATTIVVSGDVITGRKADVVLAAQTAIEAAVRKIKPGCTNIQATEMIAKAVSAFNCTPVEGVLSHQTKRHVIDGNKVIINKETTDQHVKEFNFEPNEVYHLDVYVSTGEGKPRESPEIRTTVFKRALENTYSLKLKASRAFFAELNQRFPTCPFTLRAFPDQKNARLGVNECVKHDLLH